MACVLYHGPGAREAAVLEAGRAGVLLKEPIGDDGLKVGQAREIVQMLQRPTVAKLGVVVAGPIDHANVMAADALLKAIEDPPSKYTRLILWAHDLGGVRDTIRSRCFDQWTPGEADEEIDDDLEQDAVDMLRAAQLDNLWMIPEIAKRRSKQTADMLRLIVSRLAADLNDADNQALWERLRLVAKYDNPTMLELVAALLPLDD